MYFQPIHNTKIWALGRAQWQSADLASTRSYITTLVPKPQNINSNGYCVAFDRYKLMFEAD